MLYKIVETGKTDDKCNILLKYSCYACYQEYLLSFFAKLDMLNPTICIITIGTGMLGTIFLIKKSVFIERTRDNTYITSLFLSVFQA